MRVGAPGEWPARRRGAAADGESPASLRVMQARFWRLITAPRGVGPGLAAVAAGDAGAAPLGRWIRAADEGEARERLDVYAGMYFFRLHDTLRRDLPKLAAVLGGDGFHNLVVDYLLACPSDRPSLRHAGDQMPGFLRAHPAPGHRLDLVDLARLELARNDAFDAAWAPILDPEVLRVIPARKWPTLRLAPRPDVKVLRLMRSTLSLWRAAEPAPAQSRTASLSTALPADAPALPTDDACATPACPALPPVDPTAAGAVVWRPRLAVRHRAAAPDELAALEAVLAGGSFAEVCAAFADHAAAKEDLLAVAPRACATLWAWISEGLVARVESG